MSYAETLVKSMSDEHLAMVWEALGYGSDGGTYNGLSYDDWGDLVYSEMCLRELPR